MHWDCFKIDNLGPWAEDQAWVPSLSEYKLIWFQALVLCESARLLIQYVLGNTFCSLECVVPYCPCRIFPLRPPKMLGTDSIQGYNFFSHLLTA